MKAAVEFGTLCIVWVGVMAMVAVLVGWLAGLVGHAMAYRAYRRRYPAAPRRKVWRHTR